MKRSPVAIVAALGVPLAVVLAASPTASADPGPWYSGCRNDYQPAGLPVLDRVLDVCAAPSVVNIWGFVNPAAARTPEPPPEWQLPNYAKLDIHQPTVCLLYDPATYQGPCTIPWAPRGY